MKLLAICCSAVLSACSPASREAWHILRQPPLLMTPAEAYACRVLLLKDDGQPLPLPRGFEALTPSTNR